MCIQMLRLTFVAAPLAGTAIKVDPRWAVDPVTGDVLEKAAVQQSDNQGISASRGKL
jgi:hypothetical protein